MEVKVYHTSSTSSGSASFTPIQAKDVNLTINTYKASTASFKTPQKLTLGDRVRIVSDVWKSFGGQVIQSKKSYGGLYDVEVVDYWRLFYGETNLTTKSGKRSSDIIKAFLKTLGYNTGGVKKTSTKHSKLVFKDKSYIDIINNLLWLDYQKKEYIECYVNSNGTLVYRPRKSTDKGYIFDTVYDYSEEEDASNIITGVKMYLDKDNKSELWKSNEYQNLIARWGNITSVLTASCESSTGNSSSSVSSGSDADITKAVKAINKGLRGYVWSGACTSDTSKCTSLCKGKYMDCRGMSCIIFKKLKAQKIPCKIVRYYSAAASSKTHDSVLVKYKSGWKDFDYTGMDRKFSANPSRSKTAPARIKYPK